MNNCVEGTVLHLGENLSNHEIIYLKFNCIHSIPDNNRKPAFQSTTLRPNWHKATGPQVENLSQVKLWFGIHSKSEVEKP